MYGQLTADPWISMLNIYPWISISLNTYVDMSWKVSGCMCLGKLSRLIIFFVHKNILGFSKWQLRKFDISWQFNNFIISNKQIIIFYSLNLLLRKANEFFMRWLCLLLLWCSPWPNPFHSPTNQHFFNKCVKLRISTIIIVERIRLRGCLIMTSRKRGGGGSRSAWRHSKGGVRTSKCVKLRISTIIIVKRIR